MAPTFMLSRSAGVTGGGGAVWLVMLLTMKPTNRLMIMRLYRIHMRVWILPSRVFGALTDGIVSMVMISIRHRNSNTYVTVTKSRGCDSRPVEGAQHTTEVAGDLMSWW